jgi:hypothetical protein
MPKCWADRAIVFSAILLVAWAVIGLPLFDTLSGRGHEPASQQTTQQSGQGSKDEGSWLTKDAAGFFTFGLFVVGGFQAGLFLWQLWLIRESLDDAKIAAEAAKDGAQAARDSVKLSEEALIAAQRAYVAVHRINAFSKVNVTNGEVVGWDVFVVWENAGNSPTRNFLSNVNVMLSKDKLSPDWDFPDGWIDAPPAWRNDPNAVLGTINAKSTLEGARKFIPTPMFEQVREGKIFMYIWGWATYRDVFPNTPKRVVRFGAQCIVEGDLRRSDRASFQFIHLDRYNCVDNECDKTYPAEWIPRDWILDPNTRPNEETARLMGFPLPADPTK